jgi:hypothetical protein
MTSTDDRPPTLAERYARAAVTSRIEVIERRRTDADVLLAAGWASAGNQRGGMALTLYRAAEDCREGARLIRENRPSAHRPRTLPGDLRELHDWSFPRLVQWSSKGGRWKLYTSTASEVTETVIRWWCSSVCEACSGRGYELLAGTQITSDVLCPECAGNGKPPVENRLPKKRQEAGRWLASEYDLMVSEVMAAMAAALAPSMDLNMDAQPLLTERLVELRSAKAQED